MVTELNNLLTMFSASNCTRCFVHILNLIAKSLLKQFDVKLKAGDTDDLNNDDASLLALAEDIETEELTAAQEKDDGDGEAEEDNQVDDWVDEVEALTPEECADHEESIWPVKQTLIKVGNGIHSNIAYLVLTSSSQLRKLVFKIVHSTTILLPAWKAALEDLELALKIMPRDISTQWNSTYKMLCFAVEHC